MDAHQNPSEIWAQMLESLDLLLFDDFHLLEGKSRTLYELYHLLKKLLSCNVQIVLTTSKPVANMIEESSSFSLTTESVIKLYRPDLNTKKKILMQYAKKEGINLANEALDLIARPEYQGFRELRGAFKKMKLMQLIAWQ